MTSECRRERRETNVRRVRGPDLDLLLAQDGDDVAFARFVRATETDVRRFCSWLGALPADLDDLVQDAYLNAYRRISGFRGPGSSRSWLLSIARRAYLDHKRRTVRAQRNHDVLRPFSVVTTGGGDYVDLELLVTDLPDDFREAFVLVRLMGLSYDEAADVLGCPRGTVQSRVARSRAFLARVVTASEAAVS